MSRIVCCVVRQRAQGKRVFIYIARFVDQGQNEVTASHIVGEITEETVAKGIATQVLDDGAAINIGMGLKQILWTRLGESLQEQWLNAVFPGRIDNRFMGKNGVAVTRGHAR